MDVTKSIGAALALFFLFSALVFTNYRPVRAFDFPSQNGGKPLSPDQKGTVQAGIDLIEMTGVPLTWHDVSGGTHSASLTDIARSLQNELNHGDIEQETLANDHCGWEYKGMMNLEDGWLDGAPDTRHVAEILIHEWVHKQQEEEWEFRCEDCANEVEAADAELAYKDLIGVSDESEEYEYAYYYRMLHRAKFWNWFWDEFLGRYIDDTLIVDIRQGMDGEADFILCYFTSDTSARMYSLDPLRCTDFRVLENYFPTGRGLVLACGTVPGIGGRLLALELSDIGVIGPYLTLDFAQSFYSMERLIGSNTWMIVDTLTRQIYRMEDTNADQLPDMIAGVFASAAQFPQLESMRSIQYAEHPLFGLGLIVNSEPAHEHHVIRPYDTRWFLVDADGDLMADACLPTRRCEYMRVVPQIRQVSYAGDQSVTVLGTWLHDIAVYTSDESGEMLMELLGVVHLADSVQMQCPTLRPLLAGEYIIPVDMVSGERSGAPQPVLDLAPEHLVLSVGPGGDILLLHWDPVPGAIEYAIWSSENGVDFFDTGMRTPVPEFTLPPTERQFFRVTAIREMN